MPEDLDVTVLNRSDDWLTEFRRQRFRIRPAQYLRFFLSEGWRSVHRSQTNSLKQTPLC